MSMPGGIEIAVFLILSEALAVFLIGYIAVVLCVSLIKYLVHIVSKTMYGKTHNELFKLLMAEFKPDSAQTSRLALLLSVISLPLIAIASSTVLSAVFVIDPLLIDVRSGLLLFIGIAYLFLFVYAIALFIHYFLGKYGALYKLPIVGLVRDDIKQFFDEYEMDTQIILSLGTLTYIMTIISLSVALVYVPSPLSKVVVGAVIVFLLEGVLRNKKYDNAINFIENIGKMKV